MHRSDDLFEIMSVRDEWGYPYEQMRVRLTCGCWSDWHHIGSSQWDFPDEPMRCSQHGTRQFNLTAQAMLMDESAWQ
jgi:hypothetical protein